jgi:hypothetical protein
MSTIPATEACKRCNKHFFIGNLEICGKCGKILCKDCKHFLFRKTAEINGDHHYECFDKNKHKDEPGVFVKIYNGKAKPN